MSGKLRWGLLSAARIARRAFVPGVRAGTQGEIAAVASREEARALDFAAELNIPRALGSYEALLADPEIDAVYIGLPNGLHPEWTIRAAAAGKHVLCEKPVARTRADAERMAAACRDAGVILMEAFMYRLHPQHARVKALLAEGAIGEPALVHASFHFSMPAARRTGPERDVRVLPELQGGGLMDVGCYAVNAARLIFGAEPVEVTGLQHVDPGCGVDTRFGGVLRFPGNQIAVIDGGFDSAGPARYDVTGTAGQILVEKPWLPGTDPTTLTIVRGGQRETEEVPGVDQYALEADLMAESIRAGRLLPPAEEGVAQAAVIEALYESASTGRMIKLV